MEINKISGILESILYVAGEPVEVSDIAHALNFTVGEMNEAVEELKDRLMLEGRGLRLNRHGSAVQLSICPENAKYVEMLLQPVTKQSLSQAVMETLSIIAYRQPVTRSEIEAVRGVKCDYSVQLLMNRGLIAEAGRRETLGRPMEYITTNEFLRHFGLETLADLPDKEELKRREGAKNDEAAH